jgi:aryl-alcohol dehydrogenase-like predicted oxidoreductase
MEHTIDFHTHQKVSPLGYGAGHIGQDHLDEDFVGSLVNQVLDLGIKFFDTARGYGQSEERIGRHLSWRRGEFVLSTKVGYMVHGFQDWTYDAIIAGVEQAMGRMQTHYIDVVFLHSCHLDVLKKGEVIDALQRCKEDGMVKSIGYSGEREELAFAAQDPRFDVLQCSINLMDQRKLDKLIPSLHEKKGIVAKRPLANAPWRYDQEPQGQYCQEYWNRMQAMSLQDLKPDSMDWAELALRFTLSTPEISTAIVGSLNLENIKKNAAYAEKGPLPSSLTEKIRRRFKEKDQNWLGEV